MSLCIVLSMDTQLLTNRDEFKGICDKQTKYMHLIQSYTCRAMHLL